jgi:hypothetical protein
MGEGHGFDVVRGPDDGLRDRCGGAQQPLARGSTVMTTGWISRES